MKILFLDFEATDKDVNTARITQVAYSYYDQETKKELYHYSSLVSPEGDYEFNEVAQKITGLSKEQCDVYGLSLKLVNDLMMKFMSRSDYLVAHNLHSYDLPLYKNEMKRIGVEDYQLPALIDTRFDVPWPDHIETRKLTYLAAEFGFVNPSAHSARHDVDLMAKMFFMFPFEKIVERSKSPQVWVRANVSYDDREKAKAKKFLWDGANKWWVKPIKLCDHEKETYNFTTTVLEGYKGL